MLCDIFSGHPVPLLMSYSVILADICYYSYNYMIDNNLFRNMSHYYYYMCVYIYLGHLEIPFRTVLIESGESG